MSYKMSVEGDAVGGIACAHFVPMLLHTSLCSRGERLCYFAPTRARITQSLQSLLFRRRPRRVRSALLNNWTWQLILEAQADIYFRAAGQSCWVREGAGITAGGSRQFDLRCSALARIHRRLRGWLLQLLLRETLRVQARGSVWRLRKRKRSGIVMCR